jgi:hypothetical protein
MSGPVIAAVIIPVVVVPVLFGWIAIVYFADAHPDRRLRRGAPAVTAGLSGTAPVQQAGLGGIPAQAPPPAGSDLEETLRAEWERAQAQQARAVIQ